MKATRRVLIVEDNLMNQKLAAIILHNNGYESKIAEDGMKAIETLRKESFDLILMDIQMPVLDGYQATQMIREDLKLNTPIIAMTAHALAGEKEKCIHLGMNDYLSKPFKEADLIAKVTQWSASEGHNGNGHEDKNVVDLSFLINQTKSNRPFILEMVMLFKMQNPKDMQLLEEAIQRKDFDGIYKITHTLRNTVAFFGLQNIVGEALVEIEKKARAKEGIEEIRRNFDKVKPVCDKAVSELDSMALDAFL